MDAIQTIKTALTHATFQDPDIKSATDKLVSKLGDELNAAGYDAGSEVEGAVEEVEAAITAYEETQEGGVATATGGADEDEDEFEGLGDEDE